MANIVHEQVESYIRELVPEREGLLKLMEEKALEQGVPIVQPEVARLLYCLARQKRGGRVLEIGTATGYSALWLARGIGPGGELTTIELDEGRGGQARENFARAASAEIGQITLLLGDALEILPGLQGVFDLIFIDAAKGQYPGFLAEAERLLAPAGIMVADNVLFRGLVAAPDAQIDRRHRTIVRRLREFLKRLYDSTWDTTVLPIGDGVSISIKTPEQMG